MRGGNGPGFAARQAAGSNLTHAFFNMSLGQLAALSNKTPEQFLLDLLDRMSHLAGPIWLVSAAMNHVPNSSRDWQAHCQLSTAADIRLLIGAPTVQWLDAVTPISFWNVGPPTSLHFDLGVLARGSAGSITENASVLV
jgi:hypothetical protein